MESLPIGWYQIILLGDRGTYVLTTCSGLHSTVGRLGFEPATCWSQVRHAAATPLSYDVKRCHSSCVADCWHIRIMKVYSWVYRQEWMNAVCLMLYVLLWCECGCRCQAAVQHLHGRLPVGWTSPDSSVQAFLPSSMHIHLAAAGQNHFTVNELLTDYLWNVSIFQAVSLFVDTRIKTLVYLQAVMGRQPPT